MVYWVLNLNAKSHIIVLLFTLVTYLQIDLLGQILIISLITLWLSCIVITQKMQYLSVVILIQELEMDLTINFDKIPQRMPKDVSKNSYCEIFLEFLKSTQCCVLNGRFKDDKYNFTSTNRGNAVVDYIVVPHDCFKNCVNFEVLFND